MERIIPQKMLEYLEALNIDHHTLKEKLLYRMCMAEEYLSEVEKNYDNAQNSLSITPLNMDNISAAIGISRQALYKNKPLLNYISYRTDKIKYSYLSTEKQRQEIKGLKAQIQLFHKRDAELLFWREKARQLQEQLNTVHGTSTLKLLKENQQLKEQIEDLQATVSKLTAGSPSKFS